MADKPVTGQRSPRWALMSRLTIPCENGLPYLVRLRIVQTPWFGVYLHDIFEPDGDRDPHDHPWTFVSIVLRGSYTERLHYAPHAVRDLVRVQTWRRWSVHRMGRDTAHRIIHAAPGLKTLLIVGPRRRSWGFFTEDGWVDWKDYEALKADQGAVGVSAHRQGECGFHVPAVIDAVHLERQRMWSAQTFGPGRRTKGVLDHIRKELKEIEDDPLDVKEWVDVVILALDGAWRAGWEPQAIIDAIKAKQVKNEARTWPDWRTMSEDQAIEHDRTLDPGGSA